MGERISDIAKMIILLKLLFFSLILSPTLITAQSEIYSSPYTSLKFSQCLIEKMSESNFFTLEDRNSMIGVADVLDQAIRSVEYGPFSVKILLIAFVTSLADVILTEDLSKNSFRKSVYAISLEQCSISTVGYVDSEFIKECLRIVSSLEESEVTKLRQGSSFRGSDLTSERMYPTPHEVFNPYAVNPSPVQRPFIPVESEVNGKIISGQHQRPPDFSSLSSKHSGSRSRFPVNSESDTHIPSLADSVRSQAGTDSSSTQHKSGNPPLEYDYSFDESLVDPSFEYGVLNLPPPKERSDEEFFVVPQTRLDESSQDPSLPQADGNFHRPVQTASRKKLPLGSDVIIAEREPESSDSTVLTENSQKSPSSSGGLNVPQTKESSVVVISPNTQSHNTDIVPSRDHNAQGIKTLYPQRTETSSSEDKSPIPVTTSASLSQVDKIDQEATFPTTLESLIMDIFINSTDFMNAFNSGINKHNAIKLARVITEQSLSGYNSGIIKEALNAVSNAVANVRVNSPENYALALSNALVSVLKLHNLPLFVHGSQIATNILSNLDTSEAGSTESTDKHSKDFKPDVKNASVVHEIPQIAPKETKAEIFSKILADYISESDEMANFFCSNEVSPGVSQIYFNIIKSAMDDFGEQIASTGASTTSKILLETPKQYICSNYGQFISSAITECLNKNGLLVRANAEDISNKMVLSLIQHLYATTQTQTLKIAPYDMSVESTTSLPSKDLPILQASFSSNFDLSFQETSTLPEDFYQSSPYYLEIVNHRTPESLVSNPSNEPISYIFSPSPNIYDPSPVEEFRHKYEVVNDHTSPLYSDVSQEDSLFSPTWIESLVSLSESSTERSKNYNSDDIMSVISDDILDQEELASHLLEEIESVLEVLSSKYDDHETTTPLPAYPSAESETETVVKSNNTQTILSESQTKLSSNSKESHQNSRKTVEEVTVISQTDTATSPLPQIVESIESDNITLLDHQVKIRSSRRRPETIVSDDEVVVDSYSDSNIHISTEKNQPNIQTSQFSSSGMIQYELPYDYDFEDASLSFTRTVSKIAADSIAFIRSQDFNIWELCDRLNQMAPIFKIPPLDVCEEISAIDYLLHVLRSITSILRNV